MPEFAVILPAAGSSTRFGSANKLFATLCEKPVILHSFDAFRVRRDVRMVVVPTQLRSDLWNDAPHEVRRQLIEEGARPKSSEGVSPRATVCVGGSNRAESVRNALREIPKSIEWVAVHDAARPLVSQELIDRTLAAAVEHGAAVPAMPVALTIKQATGPLPARVERTVPRERLWAMQTPQIMRRAALADAFERCPLPLEQVTDDVQLLELIGQDVWLVAGEERNLKITTPLDLKLAEMLLNESRG